jgi:hypothetical protein
MNNCGLCETTWLVENAQARRKKTRLGTVPGGPSHHHKPRRIYSMTDEFAIGDLREAWQRRVTAREAATEALRRATKRMEQCVAEELSALRDLERAEAQR